MTFELAKRYSNFHLIVQPSDANLNPPESYLFIQDGLIISCGVLYALCYIFYMTRTYKDKTCAGAVEFLCGTMSYELYYAFATTTTPFELLSFLIWFLLDLSFATIALLRAYPPSHRRTLTLRLILGTLAGLIFLHGLCIYYPDERQQMTAYWTGILLQLPIGWGSVYLMIRKGNTKGHSIEIWITRFLGCCTAYGTFFWRYINAPQNWGYVGSKWSLGIILVTMIPEFVYPFVYVRVYRWEEEEARKKEKRKGG